jgi:hypothetical protein
MANSKEGFETSSKNGEQTLVKVEVQSVEFKKADKAIKKFNVDWTKLLGGVVKDSRKEDDALATDSFTLSEQTCDYIALASSFNNARPVGTEVSELPLDFKGLTKHIRTIALCDDSRAFKKRVTLGVQHRLLGVMEVTRDLFTFNDDGKLMTAHKNLVPKTPIYDDNGKQVGMEINNRTKPTIVNIADVSRMWSKFAPKPERGPNDKQSSDATEAQATAANKEQVLEDFAQLIAAGNKPNSLVGWRLVHAVLASGITKENCMQGMEAVKNPDPAAVAA